MKQNCCGVNPTYVGIAVSIKRYIAVIKFILFFLLFCFFKATAQNATAHVSANPWQFVHLTKSDGLASNTVVDMVQDSCGFWWMATTNGLQRFDGKKFTTYRHDLEDPGSLPSDIINSLYLDKNNKLWVATALGICFQDPVTGKFIPVPGENGFVETSFPSQFFQDSLGGFWFATSMVGGLYAYSQKDNVWVRVREVENLRIIAPALIEPENGNLWFFHRNGLGLREGGSGSLGLSNLHPEAHPLFAQEGLPVTLYLDSKNKFWVATRLDGRSQCHLFTLDLKDGTIYADQHEIFSDRVVLKEDSRHRLWFFSSDNSEFGYFDVQTGDKYLYKCVAGRKNNPVFVFQGLIKIYEDRERNLWLLSNTGVYTFNPDRQQIRSVESQLNDQGKAELMMPVLSFFETSIGEIWVGTYFGGIYVFDRNMRQLRRYVHPQSSTYIPDLNKNDNFNAVWSFAEDANGFIWAGGQHGTIQLFDLKGKMIRKWQLDPPYRHTIRALVVDNQQNIWAGSQDGWIGKLNPNDDRVSVFKRAPSPGTVNCLLADNQQNIYVGQSGRIFRFSTATNQFDYTFDAALGTRADIAGFIPWNDSSLLAFGDYLYFFNKNFPSYSRVSSLKNIPILHVCAAIRDAEGSLWLATKDGFASWNPDRSQVSWYNISDGLPESDFDLSGSGYYLRDGRMLFSTGNSGFFYFHPDSLSHRSAPPAVRIVSLEVGGVARSNIPTELECTHSENTIAVVYACPSWLQQAGLHFRYRLLGHSDTWIENGDERNIVLNGMAPGKYKLQIQAINRSGLASSTITELCIRIRPPWWWSSWALLSYAIMTGLGGWALHRSLLRWKLEQANVRRTREIESFKSKFFENITHELKTPLTILSGTADLIAEDPEVELQKGIDTIRTNTNRIRYMVNQLLDLSKLNSGFLHLHTKPAELVSFLHYLCDSFRLLAKARNINLNFISAFQEITIACDVERLQQIIENLLSNALKFTPVGGNVTLSLKPKDNATCVLIQVIDNGIGIDKDALPKLFDRFYKGEYPSGSHYEGAGIGLSLARELARLMKGDLYVFSELGQGAVFTLELPFTDIQTYESASDCLEETATKDVTESQRPNLLIVEDNHEVADYLISILSGNYDIRVAFNGYTGLNEALANVPDLVISDVLMPGIDGFGLTEALKADMRTSHIPVILLTAKSGLENKLHGIGSGADAYLEKPFAKDELLAIVRQLIQSRELLRQHYMASAGLGEVASFSDSTRLAEQENTFLRTVMETIQKHIQDPAFSVDQLCAELLMSHSNLHRKIKAVAGLSPTLFIRRVRLQRAKEMLLENPLMPIYAVASACGFEDPAYFIRVFRQEFKITPANWRSPRI